MNICVFLIVCFVVIVEATMAKDVKIDRNGAARRRNNLRPRYRSVLCAPLNLRRFSESAPILRRFSRNEEGIVEAEEVEKEVDEDNVDEVEGIHEDEEDEAHDEEEEVKELGLEHERKGAINIKEAVEKVLFEENFKERDADGLDDYGDEGVDFKEDEEDEQQVKQVFVVDEEEAEEDQEFLDVDSSFVDDLDGVSLGDDDWSTDSSESNSDSDEREDDILSFRNEESEHEDEDMHQLKVVMQVDGTLVNVLNGWYLKNRIINIEDTLGAPLWQPPIEAEKFISDTPLYLGGPGTSRSLAANIITFINEFSHTVNQRKKMERALMMVSVYIIYNILNYYNEFQPQRVKVAPL